MSDSRGWRGVLEDINEQAQEAVRVGLLPTVLMVCFTLVVVSPFLYRAYMDYRDKAPCARCGWSEGKGAKQ